FNQNSGVLLNAAASFIAIGAVSVPLSCTIRLKLFLCTPIASANSLISIFIGSRNSVTSICPTVIGRRLVFLIILASTSPCIHEGLVKYLVRYRQYNYK